MSALTLVLDFILATLPLKVPQCAEIYAEASPC
jgi:hypothetical protein